MHELLAEASARGQIDGRLQVLVGGFIKLSPAAVNQMNIQDRASGAIPQLRSAITR